MANVLIDYYSFSLDLINKVDTLTDGMAVVTRTVIETLGMEWYETLFLRESGWTGGVGRRPYRFGWHNAEIGMFVHFGGQSHALIQFSGSGCKFLMEARLLEDTLVATQDRATRLDIAVDIKTDTKPTEFMEAGYNNRIKSTSIVNSPMGETCYLGSRTSQKYCRVYRYSEPHPRSKMLRVEYETKRQQARIAAKSIIGDGLEMTADKFAKYYKWEHPDAPEPSELATAIPSEVTTRSDAKTLTWLLKQAAPAFKRLVENGTISDPAQLFTKHFLPEKTQLTLFDMSIDKPLDV